MIHPLTPESDWIEFLSAFPQQEMAAGERLLIVSPHPDDETLGCGGLIQHQIARGGKVTVVAATDGEFAYPGEPGLAAKRRAEQTEALSKLGVAAQDIHRAGLPDGDVAEHEASLAGILGELVSPSTRIVTPWEHDVHPDHEACARAAATAAARTGCAPDLVFFLDLAPPTGVRSTGPRAVPASPQRRPAGHQGSCAAVSSVATLSRRCRRHFACASAGPRAPHLRGVSRRMTTLLTSREFFDEKYARDPDPWGFTSSPYELTRYATLLRALEGRRFRHAFEPGCSIGVLTDRLATLCTRVDALDISPRAIELARARCALHDNVTSTPERCRRPSRRPFRPHRA